jgi:hypothetical protein
MNPAPGAFILFDCHAHFDNRSASASSQHKSWQKRGTLRLEQGTSLPPKKLRRRFSDAVKPARSKHFVFLRSMVIPLASRRTMALRAFVDNPRSSSPGKKPIPEYLAN